MGGAAIIQVMSSAHVVEVSGGAFDAPEARIANHPA